MTKFFYSILSEMSFQNTPNTFNKFGNFVASKDAFFTKDSRNDNSYGLIYRSSDDAIQRDIIIIENDDKPLYSISLNNLSKSNPLSALGFFTYDDDGNVNPTPAIQIKRNSNSVEIADLDIDAIDAPTVNCVDLNVTGTATINTIDISTTDITCTDIEVTGTTDSTSETTGAITCAGGVGIAKNVFIGDKLTSGDSLSSSNDIFPLDIKNAVTSRGPSGFSAGCGMRFFSCLDNITGNENVAQIVAADKNGADNQRNAVLQFRVRDNTSGIINIMNLENDRVNIPITTSSTSRTTGSLTVAGGVGVSGNLFAQNMELQSTIQGNTPFIIRGSNTVLPDHDLFRITQAGFNGSAYVDICSGPNDSGNEVFIRLTANESLEPNFFKTKILIGPSLSTSSSLSGSYALSIYEDGNGDKGLYVDDETVLNGNLVSGPQILKGSFLSLPSRSLDYAITANQVIAQTYLDIEATAAIDVTFPTATQIQNASIVPTFVGGERIIEGITIYNSGTQNITLDGSASGINLKGQTTIGHSGTNAVAKLSFIWRGSGSIDVLITRG